jgi:REP element-mobilizing transposase RayT
MEPARPRADVCDRIIMTSQRRWNRQQYDCAQRTKPPPQHNTEKPLVGQPLRLPSYEHESPPRVPVWLPWEQRVIYFITMCVANREPVLANQMALNAFKAAVVKLPNWRVLAAMLMPDHLHVIVAPTEQRDAESGNFSGALKRWMRQELNASWKWEAGCFDRLLRSSESLHDKWLYVQESPVRAGLVSNSKDWPYQIGLDNL